MLQDYSPLVQTILGTCLTWFVTSIGASFCILQFIFPGSKSQAYLLDASLGFSAGVMLAASFWSLLEPALTISTNELNLGVFAIAPVLFGITVGALFVGLAEIILPIQLTQLDEHKKKVNEEHRANGWNDESFSIRTDMSESLSAVRMRFEPAPPHSMDPPREIKTRISQPIPNNPLMSRRLWLLVVAVTVHNIPEGLSVGIAFGGLGAHPQATFARARNLAIGIALQNFPEGLAVSLPLHASGYGFWTSLWYGQLSGLVEVFAGVFGCIAAQFFHKLQPFALGFAAGAMLFVVFDDVIPEAQTRSNGRLASICAMLGFMVMMILEVLTGDT